MKKFIINILCFLSILFVINVFFNFNLGKTYLGKEYSKVSLNYDSYLLADSHGAPLRDLMGEYGFFNFSANSDSYLDMLRKTRFLIRKSKVKRIFIIVDNNTLSKAREKYDNLDRSAIFTSSDDFDHKFDFLKERYIKQYISFFNPRSADVMKLKIVSEFNSLMSKKVHSIPWSKLSEEERMEQANSYAISSDLDGDKSENLVSALEEIIRLCQSNKIELTGVKFPLTKEYNTLVAGKGYNADCLFISKGFAVLDYTNIYNKNDDYFSDPVHLNEIGSVKFCETLLKGIGKFR
jgi:hypothetical protein